MISIGLSHPGDSWISRAIDNATGGLGWCHAFLVFHDLDNLVFEAHSDFGVRFRSREIADGETIFALANLTAEQEKRILRMATLLAGDKYDYGAVGHFEMSFIKPEDDAEQCAEAVVMCCQAAGLFEGQTPSAVSPNALFTLMESL